MMFVPTEIRPSRIHGTGVFLKAPVKKGDLIWRFDSRIDRVYSKVEFDSLPPDLKDFVETYSYWYKAAELWIFAADNGKFVNHVEKDPTVLPLGFGFSDHVAARDLAAGDELTEDYKAFCDYCRETGIL